MVANLGLRSQSLAPRQALRYRHASRAKANPTDDELLKGKGQGAGADVGQSICGICGCSGRSLNFRVDLSG